VLNFSHLSPLPPPAGPPSESDAPESPRRSAPARGGRKAREVRRRIAAGFYDRRDVALETARRILAEVTR